MHDLSYINAIAQVVSLTVYELMRPGLRKSKQKDRLRISSLGAMAYLLGYKLMCSSS